MIEKDYIQRVPVENSYGRAVGIFAKIEDVEAAIHDLNDAKYDMNRVSLLSRDVEAVKAAEEFNEKHGNEVDTGAGTGASTGTVLGGVVGFLIGVGTLAIPGIGPVLAAGEAISAVGSTLAGAGIGAATGGIIGALVGLGIPEEKAKVYNDRVEAGDYLLIVSGKDEESLHKVESILNDHSVEEFEIFPAEEETEVASTEVEEVPSETREVAAATDAIDITGDGRPEVLIVDKRGDRSEHDAINR